ncbi:DUF1501 domain-containing protein [Acidisphaera sp. S103]|uniref:DUF1501 domain-containing protein n=1 Tax=Acidisphaera sp. S103 TaxID=1747223 RepID=UPI00131ACCBA|nr:DUF1501 domain-containing protein [Acidisphaera sp. S103]
MSATQKDPVLVVLQLTGGNDYLNTVVPYNDPLYRDNRKAVSIGDNEILHIDKDYGFAPYLAPLKKFWDDGDLAIMHGVGYLDSPRSHFRSMDIWHTCEADKVGTEGWLGRVAREIDPKKENVVTTVSFGPTLFRALSVPDVPVACVAGPLEQYGFLPNIQEPEQRLKILERFSRMYKPKPGSGVMEYLGTTGLDSLKGADILKVAPERYKSTVKYPDSSIARKLRGIAQVHFAGLGSRIFYCDHASFDTHAGQQPLHGTLWTQVTEGLQAFMADLREHDASDNVIILMFSEFGRRVRDNGSGTDHGAAGATFVIGDKVKGGHYGEYPSLKAEKLVQGDLNPSMDFRSIYSTILDKWMGMDPVPIVNGTYEQPAFLN